MGKILLLATTAGALASDDPFWGCGLLGPVPGINSEGSVSGDTARFIEGLKAANPYNKISYWNWNLAPMKPDDGAHEYISEDFLFMPEQWGVEEVLDEYVREANSVGFLDSTGSWCPATMADIFLGANEPDIYGSCMGDMMGACTAPCTPDEVPGDCPIAHLLAPQGSAKPNSKGHCDCWSDSHATGVGYWPIADVDDPQPLPDCWNNPQCVTSQISQWKKTAKIAVAKGYKYLTTPLVAVSLDYVDQFITHACAECQDISCGCPTHIGWHFYANDCLAEGDSGYDDYQDKLDKTVALMEKWPFLKGAIVNEVGMLNCAMDTPDAICIPNGPDQKYPALSQLNHACPKTDQLPDGLASFVEELLRRTSKALTSDGRRAVASFSWFNEDMAGGTYNLRLWDDDGSLNEIGERYITACQAWASGGPLPPAPTPTPTPPAPTPTPPAPTPTPTPPAPTPPAPTPPAPTPPAPTPTPPPTPPTPPPAPTPTPAPSCNVGDAVSCPGSAGQCGGNQCCPDGSTCPSADNTFTGCPAAKTMDCTQTTLV